MGDLAAAMRAVLVMVVLALPGCVGTEAPAGERADPAPELRLDERCLEPVAATADGSACGAQRAAETHAPALEVGRAWTYAARQTYNPDPELTVVVAEAGPEGYLFAGAAEDDLVYHALWGSEWHGRHARDLNVADWSVASFRFPLHDGAEWTMMEGLGVRAHATTLATPVGQVPGFVVEGRNERFHVRYEYADAVGYYVSYLFEADGRVHEDLRLTRMETGRGGWTWFERGEIAVVANPHEPAAFDVPEGYDQVIVSAGGLDRSRALVAPPAGGAPPWQTEFDEGAEAWRHAMLPATPGRWVASVQGRPFLDDAPAAPPVSPPLGWAYLHAAPVKWIHHMA